MSKFLRRELAGGSGGLRAALVRCAGRESLRGQPAVLMLEIESLDGEVRIVDAPVRTRGDASDALVACAQGALRNQVIRAPEARPGDLHRMPFALAFWETG